MKKIKLIITDDHQLVINGIKSSLEEYEDIEIIGEALNGRELLNKLKQLQPNVVLIDIDMPIMNGFEATQEIVLHFPKIKVIGLSMFSEKSLINKMLDAGASGYLLKSVGKEELHKAIKQVSGGREYFSNEVVLAMSKPEYAGSTSGHVQQSSLSPLSEREVQVLKLIAQGFSNKEIGKEIHLSHKTVDNHRTNIMKKINVHNVAGLIRYALQNKIV